MESFVSTNIFACYTFFLKYLPIIWKSDKMADMFEVTQLWAVNKKKVMDNVPPKYSNI